MRTRAVDFEAVRRRLGGRCFICELLAGNPEYHHHVVYEDDVAVAFLNRYQTLYGYVLVAPKAHREEVTGDFSRDGTSRSRRSSIESVRRSAALSRPSVSTC